MRLRLLTCAFLLVGLTAGLASAATAPSPALVAKRAQAQKVIAQIDVIDEQLSVVTERYDSANVALAALRHRVTAERASLRIAQAQYRIAQQNVARLLVALYTGQRPSAIDVILGSDSLSGLLGLSETEKAVSREQTQLVAAATLARRNVRTRLTALETDRAAAASTVQELRQERSQIEDGLAQRQKLLSSVQAQISQIEARQRAEQERLAAEARARLAAEHAALVRRAAEQQARAERAAAAARAQALVAAKRAAAAAAATATTTAASSSTTSTADATTTTDPAATTLDPAAATSTDPGTGPATDPLPGGHPDAATLALQFIGVPYLWGGSTPSGFDCSGLVSYVFAELGIVLPHSAADQYSFGVAVPEDQLEPGDLVFFDNLDHVGIYIGDNEIVNAPHTGSFVRIDSLSEPWYANRYVGARRI
jgi:cell wall-associated NlpC family hydrolase